MNVAPNRLNIRHGELELTAEPDIDYAAYLQDWQRDHGIADGTPVCVITKESLQRLIDQSRLNVCA